MTRQDEILTEAQVARVEATRLLARNAVILAENNLRTLLGDAFTNRNEAPLVPRDELVVVHEPLDLEASHRATVCCHLANISYVAGRKIRWDAAAEAIPGDAEAAALLARPRRRGYDLPAA